jgi:hypothetical protein
VTDRGVIDSAWSGSLLGGAYAMSQSRKTVAEPGVLHQRPAEAVVDAEKREFMPDLHPVAEDIDEHAARRSIRVTLIIVSAALLLPLLGFLAFWQFGHRPTGGHHSPSVWAIVILLAVMGITLVVMVLLVRRQYRRPGYRRVMQYGWRHRWRVGKDLRRGRALSAEDMPLAKALVDLQRSQRKWILFFYCGMPLIYLLNGLTRHGSSRWFYWGFAACFLVLLPFALRQQRQMTQGYERQITPTVGDHDDATASGTAG